MGMDIHGWVEAKTLYQGAASRYIVPWYGVIVIDGLLNRNYDMFSCLFGVKPFVQFTPIAPARGLPPDISEQASNGYLAWQGAMQQETWISWSEILAIDWDETGLDTRPRQYAPDASGNLIYVGKAISGRPTPLVAGEAWRKGKTVYGSKGCRGARLCIPIGSFCFV